MGITSPLTPFLMQPAVLVIEQEQHNMKRVTLRVTADDPDNADEILVDQDRAAFRHEDSAYEDD